MTDDTQTQAALFMRKYPLLWRLLSTSSPPGDLSHQEQYARMLLCGELLLHTLENMMGIIAAEEAALKKLCDASAYHAPETSYYPRL